MELPDFRKLFAYDRWANREALASIRANPLSRVCNPLHCLSGKRGFSLAQLSSPIRANYLSFSDPLHGRGQTFHPTGLEY
jgi:hypothetical protein